MRQIKLLLMILAVVLFTGCNLNGNGGTPDDVNGYVLPGETAEGAAHRELGDLLSSSEGQKLSPARLANLKRYPGYENINVHIPSIGAEDLLPREGVVYKIDDTGSTMTFKFSADRDSLNTIGTVDYELRNCEIDNYPTDTLITFKVESHGRSIYSLYNIIDVGTKLYPDGRPRWEGTIFYVYPGADSIEVSHGLFRRIYHAQSSKN